MHALKITENLYWTGVGDPNLRRFDIVMETKKGTTYNSYVIKGSDKIALIDGSKLGFEHEWLVHITEVVDPKKIDILVVQHTEPDHSSAIGALLALNPHVQVYGSMLAMNNLAEIVNQPFNRNVVRDGQKLELGGYTLQFLLTPNVHWPDTMMTFVPQTGHLFTCDFLGAHIATDNLLVSKLGDELSDYHVAFEHYYETIMKPLKPFARQAWNKIKDLPLTMVLPSHGPVLDQPDDVKHALASYEQWTKPIAYTQKQVTIVYCSNYGYTKKIAETIFNVFKRYPLDVTIFDIIESERSVMIEKLLEADLVLWGSPTIVADAIHPVYDLMNQLTSFQMSGKKVSAFGSYGWSGEAVPYLLARAKQLKMDPLDEGLKIRLNPSVSDLVKVETYADQLATHILGK